MRQRVLLDALIREVGDAEILGAIFTTYTLDPGFFQDEVLARLLGQDSTMVRARRLLARELLGEVRPVVLYDAETVQGGQPLEGFRSDLPVHFIPVNHPTGAFHPKLCLLLTGPLPGADSASVDVDGTLQAARLVVLVASANLTPSGWRRNVEVAWTGVVERGEPCAFRDDLLGEFGAAQSGGGLLDRFRVWCGAPGERTLDLMADVVRSTVPSAEPLPRLWHGQQRLDLFLRRHLPDRREDRHVEVFAPFVSEPRPTPVKRLVAATGASTAIVRAPQDREGVVSASEAWVKAVDELNEVVWGDLPRAVTTTGAGKSKERAATRFVHAKAIRVCEGTEARKGWVLSGSPNLTLRGHSGVGPKASNVEVAVLAEAESPGSTWLEPTRKPRGLPEPLPPPEERAGLNCAGIQVVVDWEQRTAEIRVESAGVSRVRIFATSKGGKALAGVKMKGSSRQWTRCKDAEPLLQHLERASAVWASAKGFDLEAVLVEERGLLKKPDVLSRELTPADILSIWATLEPFRREKLLEDALRRKDTSGDGEADVLNPASVDPGNNRPLNLFERQAGQFFAFHILKRRVRSCFATGRPGRAEVMVFGTGGDSVRSMAKRVVELEQDAVERLILLLCCKEVLEEVGRLDRQMLVKHSDQVSHIDLLLEESWAGVDLPEPDRQALREWVLASWPGLF